jgi:hypothetical protein
MHQVEPEFKGIIFRFTARARVQDDQRIRPTPGAGSEHGRPFRLLNGAVRIERETGFIETSGYIVGDMDVLLPGRKGVEAVDRGMVKACPQAPRCGTIGIGQKTDDPFKTRGWMTAAIGFWGEHRMPCSPFIIKPLLNEGSKKINAWSPSHYGQFHLMCELIESGGQQKRIPQRAWPDNQDLFSLLFTVRHVTG